MTEVASISDSDVQGLDCLLEQADHFQTGWTYGLSWSNPNDELRRLAAESAPTGAAPFKQLILARVFPRAIAGAPKHYSFNVRNGRFRMTYLPRHDDGAPTIISIPVSVQYPRWIRRARDRRPSDLTPRRLRAEARQPASCGRRFGGRRPRSGNHLVEASVPGLPSYATCSLISSVYRVRSPAGKSNLSPAA